MSIGNNVKEISGAKIRNRYNQVPQLTQDTTWESEGAQGLSGRVLDSRPRGRGSLRCVLE